MTRSATAGPALGFRHGHPFDPSYGLTLAELLRIEPPAPPAGFAEFWRARHAAARAVDPAPRLNEVALDHPTRRVFDLRYASTGGVAIGGWLTLPRRAPPIRGLVVGHGYGGRDGPDLACPGGDEAAVIFPCVRGLSRSARPDLSSDPGVHVVHGIADRATYVIGGCVDDLWLAVSALLVLHPELAGRIGYSGLSLGGGLGALALPWDDRIARAELLLPTFGHQALRLTLPSTGSVAGLQAHEARVGGSMATLQWYDAAMAAGFVDRPLLIGCALFDPAVAPPGQFAVHNAAAGPKDLVIFDAGHFDYPGAAAQETARIARSTEFFAAL
ncbi:hypothetical protein EYW49_17530 [Siculibacillus lacustris]|uniref:Acetyl xylan esterase domain-containing protein n=1 Tax=Siculibacillus lacustris TaxID=1549641 RepID=A0A4Q9VHS9_9HYPH|nr:acetylxylan esterase [Siculibacillus lacustris]TBW34722.1 hypothetical protein EYW49_17530 [Siculibacillus lacustris]